MEQESIWMRICMIATTLFSLIIGIAVIIQTFLQAKILKELWRFNKER